MSGVESTVQGARSSTGQSIGLRCRRSPTVPARAPEQRFWEKVDKGDGSGCWNWTGALNSAGYGSFAIITMPRPVNRSTHRISWEWANGRDVPPGLVVLHACDNRRCVRPDHLSVGTVADNNRDMFAKGRHPRRGYQRCGICGRVGIDRRSHDKHAQVAC